MPELTTLTLAQQRAANDLLSLGEQRPAADLSWGPGLAAWIDDALAEHVDRVGSRQLWVSKGSVSGVHGCEASYLATKGDFTWTIDIAKGVVIHHAIALAAAGSKAPPRDLAYAAMDQVGASGGRSLGTWLIGLSDQQRVEVVAGAVVGIDGFLSAFPPLRAAWHPVAEYPVSATIADGHVRVTGRVDLALGHVRPGPDKVLRRRRLFLEIKTGRPRPEHRAEHLLYALLETLRSGVAPFRAATYYTGDGTRVADDITEELLMVAGMRLIDATQRLIELGDGREPDRKAGWRCGFCPLAPGCPERLRAEALSGETDAG
jgi:hypothetical protein